VEETGVPGENHHPTTYHWQTLSWKPPTCHMSLTNFIMKTTDLPHITDKLYHEKHRPATCHWQTLSWKPPTCHMSLTNFIMKTTDLPHVTDKLYHENHWPVTCHWQTLSHKAVSNTPRHEWHLNSQLWWWYRHILHRLL
jgi:hypothetical protein